MSAGAETERVHRYRRVLLAVLFEDEFDGWATCDEIRRHHNLGISETPVLRLLLNQLVREGDLIKAPNPSDGRSVIYRWATPAELGPRPL